jgi:hypothetical protein
MAEPRIWVPPGSGAPESARSRPEPVPTPQPGGRSGWVGRSRDAPRERETEIPLRPLGASEILDGAITCVRRSPRATLGLSAILTGVVQVILVAVRTLLIGTRIRSDATPGEVARSLGPASLVQLVEVLLTTYVVLLLSGMLAPVIGRMLLGRTTSFARTWTLTRSRLPRVLGTASAVMGALLIAVALPLGPAVLAGALGAPAAIIALALVLGVPAAFLLMIACYVWLALATPIAVLEDRGVFAAMRRSAEIVRGSWWRVFGVLALALAITVFVGDFVLQLPFAAAQAGVLAVDKEPTGWLFIGVVAIGAVGAIIAGTLVAPFDAGVIGLLYADRRMRREAFDLELALDPPEDRTVAWLPGPLTAAGSGRQPRIHRPPIVMPPPGWRR